MESEKKVGAFPVVAIVILVGTIWLISKVLKPIQQ
jgi:hypothetical protein